MLLRYIKETSSNEERSSIEAWLEADEGNERILLQTARIYYANNVQERIASRDPLAAYEKLDLAEKVFHGGGMCRSHLGAFYLDLIYER